MFSKTRKREPRLTALDWEVSEVALREKSERRAWMVAAAAVFCAIACAIAVMLLTPLKAVTPYLIYVDRFSGETKVQVGAAAEGVADSEIIDKYWISSYVSSRERYYINFLQNDYDKTMLMSGPLPRQEYDKQFDGPNSLYKVMGGEKEYRVKLISITLLQRQPGKGGNAVVRFEKTLGSLGSPEPGVTTRNIATLSFTYEPPVLAAEKQLLQNPVGFKVVAYRVDPELASVSSPPAARPAVAMPASGAPGPGQTSGEADTARRAPQ